MKHLPILKKALKDPKYSLLSSKFINPKTLILNFEFHCILSPNIIKELKQFIIEKYDNSTSLSSDLKPTFMHFMKGMDIIPSENDTFRRCFWQYSVEGGGARSNAVRTCKKSGGMCQMERKLTYVIFSRNYLL